MPPRALGLLVALLLGGCATAYHPKGFGGNYSERRLDADVFYVSVRGDEYTSRQAVETYALYRSAELTLRAGYDSFEVVGGNTDARTVLHTTAPGSYVSTTTASAKVSGNTDFGSSITFGTYTPGPPSRIRNYEATLLIKVSNGPNSHGQRFDAREVLKYLGPDMEKK